MKRSLNKPDTQRLTPSAQRRTPLPQEDLKGLITPILKRLPTYLKLGWALGKEAAIPRKHKVLLYSAVLYTVSPLHVMMSPVPVVGQVDSVVLFLLGIRQALLHAPPEIVAHHLERLKLRPTQLERDLCVVTYVAWHSAGKISALVRRHVPFVGRVARGFTRRLARRLTSDKPPDK